MLKIKDNVNLKELEKFGFEKLDFVNDCGDLYDCILWRNGLEDINIFETFTNSQGYNEKYVNLREIVIMDKRSSYIEAQIYSISNVIYDLIKADLVEKVEE